MVERKEEQRRGKKPIATPNSQIYMHIMVIILQEQLVLADNLASGQPGTGGYQQPQQSRIPTTRLYFWFFGFFPIPIRKHFDTSIFLPSEQTGEQVSEGECVQDGAPRWATRRSLRPGLCSPRGFSSRPEPREPGHKLYRNEVRECGGRLSRGGSMKEGLKKRLVGGMPRGP